MSVAVQKMVNARTAGVAMTLNPINGDRSKVVIDASWGLGEAVVGGEVTPDNFTVDKVIFEIVGRTVSAKQIEYVVDHAARRVVERAIEEPRQSEPSLSDAEVIAVARLARKAERFYRTPQDIEWAIDADLPAPDNIMLLQSRPETVWSQRGPSGLGKQATSTAGVLDTLLKPVQVKLGK
jgi:pyruvate, water dikinase